MRLIECLYLVSDQLRSDHRQEQEIANNENQKVFVVPVAETIIDEGAVVVEKLRALVAEQTMEARFRFYDLTVGAKVHQVFLVVDKLRDKLYVVVMFLKLAWIQRD